MTINIDAELSATYYALSTDMSIINFCSTLLLNVRKMKREAVKGMWLENIQGCDLSHHKEKHYF